MRRIVVLFLIATGTAGGGCAGGNDFNGAAAIPFEAFANFERINDGKAVFSRRPPEWAAAAHAIVIGDTVHYLWGKRKKGNYWVLMHSTAPASDPAKVTHDPRNPVVTPSREGFDDYTTEYPFPFRNPTDGRLYAYYLGRRNRPPKQTGLLVCNGDLGRWSRVTRTPVIAAENHYERKGSSHPSVAVAGDTIHILYTGESDSPPVICHATAPTTNPPDVAKDPANPVFEGTGRKWDAKGVREAEIFKGPQYFHIFYGGYDGNRWRIGHVRTRDFCRFEPNPHNPIFTPSKDPRAWDSGGVLTPQVFRVGDVYYMLYAGQSAKNRTWQTGLARSSYATGKPVR